jgi:hypothetical protein
VRVPYSEGVANHTDPLPCVGHREVTGEALAGESWAPATEPRKSFSNRNADAVLGAEGNMDGRDIAMSDPNPAWSETLACAVRTTRVRRSDPAIVAGKPTNRAERSAAEPVERV